MKSKIITAVITGVFGLVAGIIGTYSVMNINNNQNVVTVNVNGEKMSVSLDEYEKMYNDLKKDYDALSSENKELITKKNASTTNQSSTNEPDNEDNAYIGEQITAYYSTMYYKEYSSLDTESFSMGKHEYTRGFIIGATEEYGTAYYNLDGKYTCFSGMAGNLDDVNQAATYGIYGDDKLLSTIEVKGAALPKEFNIDVTGVRQLKIICGNKDLFVSGYNVGFADAAFT